MDRDVYLILIGAGISLASSAVTLLLQFGLGLIRDTIERKREEENRRKEEVRAELIRKDIPIHITGPFGIGIEKKIESFPSLHAKLFGWTFIADYKAVFFSLLIGIIVFIVVMNIIRP